MVSGKRILLLAPTGERDILSPLEEEGFAISVTQAPRALEEIAPEATPDLLIVDLDILTPESLGPFIQGCKRAKVPILALVPEVSRPTFDPNIWVDDFLLRPIRADELRARVRRVLWLTGGWDSRQVIRVGDMVIDQERYEVSVAGRKVILTFKEYQLLRMLATSPGRVYSRETLLSQIWGYDYFGGTRTVDVHVRRVRSKVEDASHQFIETVRNVGYRFRAAG